MKQRYDLSKGTRGRITPPPESQGKIEPHAHNDEIVVDDESKAQIRKLRKIAYKGGFPRLYHVTSKETAAKILAEGFRDGESAQPLFAGVSLSNTPLDGNEGAYGDTVLIVQFRVSLRRLSRFVVIEEGKNSREWVMPAAFIVRHATITMSRRHWFLPFTELGGGILGRGEFWRGERIIPDNFGKLVSTKYSGN